MARSRARRATLTRTLSVPARFAEVRLPVVPLPDIRYVQHLTKVLDVSTVRNTVRRQVKLSVPIRPKREAGSAKTLKPVALLGRSRTTPKHAHVCKCVSGKSERQREASRKFFARFGSRRSGGGSITPKAHACHC